MRQAVRPGSPLVPPATCNLPAQALVDRTPALPAAASGAAGAHALLVVAYSAVGSYRLFDVVVERPDVALVIGGRHGVDDPVVDPARLARVVRAL